MVKIVDIEEQLDVSRDDDDCVEIDPAEFAMKLNLKETDDVIIVAAKGEIVKVEVDQPEGFAKALYGSGSKANLKHVAAGDCIDNPYKVEEDKMSLLKVEIDADRFVLDKSSDKFHSDDGHFCLGDKDDLGCDTVKVVPGKLVVKLEPVDSFGVEVVPDKPVKCEPVGDNGVEGAEDGSYDYCLGVSPNRRIFDEEDDEDVVVV